MDKNITGEVVIKREGDKIILPKDMSYSEGREWLTRMENEDNLKITPSRFISCYPFDGALALTKAMKNIFGFTQVKGESFFGMEMPPQYVEVQTGIGTYETVVIGNFMPPPFEGGKISISPSFNMKRLGVTITGNIKKKFEKNFTRIVEEAENILRTESIYKGKAIRVDLSKPEPPKFMDLRKVNEDDLILNKKTEFHLTVSLWARLEQSYAVKKQGIPLKHGSLLVGPYGVGKTLSARVTAKKAEENGWTFIYLEDGSQLDTALRLATLYSPAVIFAEDIDRQFEGDDRTKKMNEMLNVLDGIDTKDNDIITILTTNHPENINKAFLRAGRIDSVIPMGAPDAETAVRFLRHFGGDLIKPNENLKKAGKALDGFVPAFIAEAINKAKMFAINREGDDIVGKVTANDLVLAAETLRSHNDMISDSGKKTEHEVIVDAITITGNALNNGTGVDIKKMSVLLNGTVDRINDYGIE